MKFANPLIIPTLLLLNIGVCSTIRCLCCTYARHRNCQRQQ